MTHLNFKYILLKINGGNTKMTIRKNININEMTELYKTGSTLSQLAEKYEISRQTVANYIFNATGFVKRPKNKPEITTNNIVEKKTYYSRKEREEVMKWLIQIRKQEKLMRNDRTLIHSALTW